MGTSIYMRDFNGREELLFNLQESTWINSRRASPEIKCLTDLLSKKGRRSSCQPKEYSSYLPKIKEAAEKAVRETRGSSRNPTVGETYCLSDVLNDFYQGLERAERLENGIVLL